MATEFSHEANQSPATAERRAEILANPGFGDYFSDHMVTIDWEGDLSLIHISEPTRPY